MKIVVNGPGAAGTAITWLLRDFDAKNITLSDEYGILYPSRDNMEWHKKELAETFNKEDVRGNLSDAVKGADVFIGVSKGNLLTTDMVKSMNKDAIIFAMANPTPEILPDVAKRRAQRLSARGAATSRIRSITSWRSRGFSAAHLTQSAKITKI